MNFQSLFNYIVCFCFGYLLSFLVSRNSSVEPVEVTKDSIIRDSIYIINDSIIKQLVFVEKEYDKNIDVIVNADDSTQYELFSEYIEDYNRTNKDSQLNICGTPEIPEANSFATNTNK